MLLFLATMLVSAVGSTGVEEFTPVGSFANVRSSTGEHCYGYSLELWRHNGRIIGLFDHHQGLCGDPPCEALQDVSYDRGSGHLTFSALDSTFAGNLRKDDVVGTIDGMRVRLAKGDFPMDGKSDKSFEEWCAFWRGVHRCKGVDQVCAAAAQ
jgi:hypothetical protein